MPSMQDKELARSAVAEHELEHEHYDRPAFFDEAMYGQAVEEALEASCETFLCLAETDLNQLPQPAAPANEAPDPQQAMVALRLPFLRNTQAAERERIEAAQQPLLAPIFTVTIPRHSSNPANREGGTQI